MTILDAEATFLKVDKLRERMERLERLEPAPDPNEWQYTRLLIRALSEAIGKSKKSSIPVSRRIRDDAPAAVSGDWDELVEVLSKRGIKSESRKSALRRK